MSVKKEQLRVSEYNDRREEAGLVIPFLHLPGKDDALINGVFDPPLGDLAPTGEIKGGQLTSIHKVTDVTLKRGII